MHIDIWVTYTHYLISESRYFIALVDDASRVIWIYFMKHKFETTKLLSEFLKSVKTQLKFSIKAFKYDNYSEFTSSSCQELFFEPQIYHQKSALYTFQQNGRVGRKQKQLFTLVEK